MDTDQKLIEVVKALLQTAGFDNLAVMTSSQSLTLTGDRGEGGAVFHLTTAKPSKTELARGLAGQGPAA